MRLLLVEALLLAGAAATLGTLLSLWIQNVLMRLFSVETLFVHDQGVSWPVLGFALGLAVLTGVGFGMLPAWRARRPDLMQALKGTGKGSSRSGSRLRGALVAAQIGVSFVLLTVAGLLSRSLISLYQSDPGFDPRNLLTVEVPLPPRDYNGPRRTAFFESLLGQIRAAPGVQSAGAISQLPLRNPGNDISVYDASRPPTQPSERGNGYQRVVLPGYFQAMGIPLLAGRDVRSSDTQGVARVVVISRTLASRLFGESDPLGRKIIVDGAANEPWEVVGLVADVKATDLSEAATSRGAFYRPHAQLPINIMRIAVRTEVPPESLVGDLRSIVRKLDPHVPLAGPRTMEQLMDNVTVSQKAQTIFLTTFSLLAMVLAAVGIHGLLAYRVRLQQREIGIRMALGADPKHVAWGVLREAGLLTLFGALGGILGALAVSQLLRSSLHGIGPFDPFVLATAALVLVILAIGAAWFPARRAIRVNPAHVLSAE